MGALLHTGPPAVRQLRQLLAELLEQFLTELLAELQEEIGDRLLFTEKRQGLAPPSRVRKSSLSPFWLAIGYPALTNRCFMFSGSYGSN